MPAPQLEKSKATKKPQARGFNPNAMAQAQALNQQPDSIPAMMKPGEYVLPPDTVAAMGGPQALDATVAKTHTPTNAGAIVPRGFGPRLFFNNGGLVQDEEQKPKPISPTNTYPQGSPSAGANVYGGAIDAAKSAVSAAANPQGGQPLAKGVEQVFGNRDALQQQGRERWDASVAARQPAPAQRTQAYDAQVAPVAPSAPQPPTTDEANTRLSQQITAAQNQQQARMAAAQRTQAYDSTARQQLGQQSTADTGPASFTGDVLRTAGQDAQAAWQRGGAEGVGAAAGALVRGSMATPGAIAVDAVDSVVNGPIGQGIGGFARGFFGGAGQDPASAAPAQKAAAGGTGTGAAAPGRTPEQLAKQLGGLDRQHAQNVQLQSAARTPEQARAEAAQQPVGQQVQDLPGVYQHGKGQYSDNPEGMGFATGFTGQPSAQNMQAANVLASQQQAQSTARVQAAAQQAAPQARGFTGFEMPRQESAYEREARQRERNRIMGMLQTPLTGDPRRDLTASQRQQLVAQLGQESQERQATERNMFGLAGQQLNAETQRYSTDANTAVGMARNAIDQQRLGMDAQQQQEQSTARGFEIRGAQRREGILQQFDAAKTDQERAQLQQRYPDVFGKSDKENLSNSFMKVKVPIMDERGNVVGDQEELIDLRTLRQGEANGQGAQAGIPKVGDTRDGYRYKGGNPNDKASWQKV